MLDDETDVIGMYVEGVQDGRRFFDTLREACKRKPVVVWKGGQTEAGARATMSHTGSLAAPQAIWEGMMRQCGAITTNNLDETIDVMKMLLNGEASRAAPAWPCSPRPAASPSPSPMRSRKAGLRGPTLHRRRPTQQLGEFFNIVGGSFQNPLDMAGTIQGTMETLRQGPPTSSTPTRTSMAWPWNSLPCSPPASGRRCPRRSTR